MDHYRKTRAADLDKLRQAGEVDALSTGLSIRANRVGKLQELAERLEADILTGESLWVTDVKNVAGEMVYITRFNKAEVEEYRATLAQIAEETGDKKPGQIIPSEITVRFVKPTGQP